MIQEDIKYIKRAITQWIVDEDFLLSVKPVYPLAGRHPKVTRSIFQDVIDTGTAEAGGVVGIVAENGHLVAVIAVEPIKGAEPHVAFLVFVDTLAHTLGKSLSERDVFEVDLFMLSLAEQACSEKT